MRRLALAAVLVLVALATLDWLAWHFAVATLGRDLNAWSADARRQGWDVRSDPVRRAGFPFAATLILPRPVIHGAGDRLPGGATWQADEARLTVSLFHPTTLLVTPMGQEVVRVSDLPAVSFLAETLAARIPLGEREPRIIIKAATITGGLATSAQKEDVRIDAFSLTLATHHEDSGRVRGEASGAIRNLALPDIGQWPLGAIVNQIDFGATALAPPSWGGTPVYVAHTWQQEGGTLDVARLHLRWGPLNAALSGRATLDAKLQPAGHGTARVSGEGAALDALSVGGAITPGVASTAKAVLALMQHQPGEDGAPTLTLPFEVKNSTLLIGRIPIAKLGEIDWNGSS